LFIVDGLESRAIDPEGEPGECFSIEGLFFMVSVSVSRVYSLWFRGLGSWLAVEEFLEFWVPSILSWARIINTVTLTAHWV